MTSTSVHTCPSCNASNTSLLSETALLVCKNCGDVVTGTIAGPDKRKIVRVPPDWSYIQLQTTGTYAQRSFTVVGRIRLQLRNDYKNFWCAALPDGGHLWIMESFGSIAVFPAVWSEYDKQVSALRAGQRIGLKKDVKLTGEYVEKCEDLTFEGEIGNWKLFTPYFFFIQGRQQRKPGSRLYGDVQKGC